MYLHTGNYKRIDGWSQLSRIVATAAVACGMVATVPSVGAAQQPASRTSQLDARWQPWIGCWRPAAPQTDGVTFSQPRNSNAPLVCVLPEANGTGVSVLTVDSGKIASRDSIEATGQNVARSKDGCTGVENAAWSTDGHRLYVSSDFTCPGGLKRTTSGMFAMSPRGEWVNVQSVNVGGNKGVNALHYVDAGIPSRLPAEISTALHTHGLAVSTARAAAGARLTTASVVEASQKLDPTVVEAWIVDRGQSFGLDAKQIVALADAGVPGNVTDAMVAVTYPKSFNLDHSSPDDALAALDGSDEGGAGIQRADRNADRNNVQVMMMPEYSRYNYSPFGYSPYDYYGYGYSPYGYSPYGYAPYRYSPFGSYYSAYPGYGGIYGGYYPPPIIVLKGSQPAVPHGRAIKGSGYTRSPSRRGSSAGQSGQSGQGSRSGQSSGSNGSTASPRPVVAPPPPPPPQPASTGHTAHKRP